MDMIADCRESTVSVRTGFMFGELLESISCQLLIFDVERLVLLHICLVLECEVTRSSPTEGSHPRKSVRDEGKNQCGLSVEK
jgi:hypothetical protein